MPTRTYNSNDQVVYAQYVGSAPTAPNDIYEYDFSIEPDIASSTYWSGNSPIATATPVGKVPTKNGVGSSADASNMPIESPCGASCPQPVRPTATILTTTTITAVPPRYPCNTITGNELLRMMKEDRKRKTLGAGIVWGAVGFLILGPIGAVVFGGGLAITAKRSLKRQEQALRQQFQNDGTLDKPVAIPIGLSRRQRKRILRGM